MKKYNSKDLLENLHQQTEQHILKAIAEWQNAPAGLLNHQPPAGGWSAAQCIEHLNLYGRYYLPAIERAIQKATDKKFVAVEEFKSGWLGNYFTNLMLPNESGSVKKMKAPANARPAADLPAAKVVAEFIDQQEKLLFLLQKARAIDMNKVRIPISIAHFVNLKLGDVFMFFIAHNYRHMLQAEKALRVSGSYEPKNIINGFKLA